MKTSKICCEMMKQQLTFLCDQHKNKYECPDALIDRHANGRMGIIVHDGDLQWLGLITVHGVVFLLKRQFNFKVKMPHYELMAKVQKSSNESLHWTAK